MLSFTCRNRDHHFDIVGRLVRRKKQHDRNQPLHGHLLQCDTIILYQGGSTFLEQFPYPFFSRCLIEGSFDEKVPQRTFSDLFRNRFSGWVRGCHYAKVVIFPGRLNQDAEQIRFQGQFDCLIIGHGVYGMKCTFEGRKIDIANGLIHLGLNG
ncbi:MAG: hypothetical protein BWY09_01121 [Candidatus Hydrogenedentes bacterium ADurb.Bin179]|nr:MAG: hypothetical protein BWY09_01121 [Candidatus Hydrogenedentes bacterium ADurb.Bin179]